ncbi:hypothetical protein PRIPAC_90278, partial [Pristionchus pacificus]|uniref:Chromo domain-containing protein n=1 Tax=Pristionchus pacificus TaxID=54126 RepID=A0A2A6CXU8_PRIPA
IMVRASTSKKPKTYQVDRLWDRRIEGGQKQYLTSWEGYEDKTWEPVDNLSSKTLLSLMKELDQILDDPTHPKPEWYRKFLQQKQRGIDVMKHGIDYEPPTKRCREATPTAFADAPVPAKTPARFAPSLQSAATTLVARSSPAALRRPTTATSLREAAAARPTAAAPERAASATPHATAASRNGTASPVPSTTRVAARHSFPAPPRVASESDAEADRDSVDVTPSPLVPSTSRAASRSSLAATTQVAAMSSPKVASTSSRTAARYSSPAPSRNKTNTPAPPAVPHTQVAAPVPFTVETPLGAITAVEPDSLLAEYTMENEATRDELLRLLTRPITGNPMNGMRNMLKAMWALQRKADEQIKVLNSQNAEYARRIDKLESDKDERFETLQTEMANLRKSFKMSSRFRERKELAENQ